MNHLMLHEFPQGDPYSGPAYGDKHKSKGLGMVIGVVASVMTMGAAMPLLASTMVASQIAGGAMMAGGILSGVGAVTGNKKLMKVGGVLALAGGLGNMAAGALDVGQVAGSGSQAVSEFGTNFMESVNGLGVGDLYNPETISSAKEAASSAFDAAGDTVAEVATDATAGISLTGEPAATPATSGQTVDLAKASAVDGPMTDASMDALNLTDNGLDSNMRAVQNNGAGVLNRSEATIQPGTVTPTQVGRSAVTDPSQYTPTASEKGPLDKLLGFTKEQPELTKIGAGMLEKAMAAGSNDEQVSALIDRYKAEANLLTTRNDVEQYKLANAGKQVAMISADDPEIDAKVKQAAAGNIPVAFIPVVGKNYTPVSKNFTPVARNATYNQPTA